jgi:hypothetical protein
MTLMHKQVFLVCIFAFGISTVAYTFEKHKNWYIKIIKDNVIYFSNGEKLKTDHFGVKLVGELPLNQNSPLYIFSGDACADCCSEKMVFLVTPGEKNKIVTPEYAPYDFPGKEFSTTDSTLQYESRMFYGNVLPDVQNGIIWYQTMLDDDNQYRKSVYLIRVENGRIYEDLIFENVPDISATLSLMNLHKCNEVAGADTVSEP